MPMSPRDRRALIILGVIVGVALVAFFLLKPKGGGEEAAPSPSATSPGPAPSVSPSSSPRETTSPPGGPLVGGHDPFSPLINPSGGGVGPSGGTTSPGTIPPGSSPPFSSPPGGGGGPTSPSGSPPSVSPPGSPGPTPSGGTGTQMGGHKVTLIDIFVQGGSRKAQVSVDGKVFVVTPGETFDGNFELVAINGDCGTFLFGDQQFILCENPLK